jgi:hypothetical protein
MNFNWFKLFNLDEFLALGLVSKVYQVVLEGVGQKNILVTSGNLVSIVYDDVLLALEFEADNPFVRQGDDSIYAIYRDSNGDVHLGIEATT